MNNEILENKTLENLKLKIALDIMIDNEKNEIKNNKLLKIVVMFVVGIIFFASIGYAEEIGEYIKNYFLNSNMAIQEAIEDGYVQKSNEEFVYSNEFGIKMDSLVLDDTNLNISFLFNSEKENIKSIRFNDFIISTDSEQIIYRSKFKAEDDVDKVPIYNSFNWKNNPVKINDNYFADSMLIGLSERYKEFNEVLFDIQSIDVTYIENETERVDTVCGEWNFKVQIIEEMKRDSNIYYELVEENEFISKAKAKVSPTGMVLEVDFKQPLSRDLHDWPIYYVVRCNDKTYEAYGVDRSEVYAKIMYDDIGIFMETYDEFEFNILFLDTTVTLKKVN